MNAWGWALMGISCGFVILLNLFCFYRVLRKHKPK